MEHSKNAFREPARMQCLDFKAYNRFKYAQCPGLHRKHVYLDNRLLPSTSHIHSPFTLSSHRILQCIWDKYEEFVILYFCGPSGCVYYMCVCVVFFFSCFATSLCLLMDGKCYIIAHTHTRSEKEQKREKKSEISIFCSSFLCFMRPACATIVKSPYKTATCNSECELNFHCPFSVVID